MMRRLLTILLLLTLLPLAGIAPAAAQDDAAPWYFGWHTENNQLIAYTLEGETRVLLEQADYPFQAYRIGPDEVLMAAEVNGQIALVRATPQAATVIPMPPGFDLESFSGLNPLAFHHPYMLFVTDYLSGGGMQGVLLDLDAGTTTLLDYVGFLSGLRQAGISADGTALRYLRHDDPDAETWYLVERSLASGEETVLFTFEDESRFPPVTMTSSDGGYWLLRDTYDTDDDVRFLRSRLLQPDGSVEILFEGDLRDPAMVQFSIYEDLLLSIHPLCEADCTLTVTPLAGGEGVTFSLPPQQDIPLRISLLYRYSGEGIFGLGTNRVLALTESTQYWLLEADGQMTFLGHFASRMGLPPDFSRSLDGRYLLTVDNADEPTRFTVLDVLSGQPVMSDTFGGAAFARLLYRPRGFVVYDDGDRQAWFYDSVNQVVHELPQIRGSFFEVLPDGALLGMLTGFEGEDLTRGIYRYDAASGAVTPLLEGVAPLNVRDL